MQTSLERIQDFTANFFFWQGLRWVPLGAALLLSMALPSQFDELGLIVLFTIAMLLSNAAGRWYRRTYGHVRGIPNERRDWWKWSLVYPLMFGSLILDGIAEMPFLVSGPVWGAAIVVYWNSTGRGRLHYLVIAAVFACSVSLDVRQFLMLVGGAYVIGGLLDHFELTRMMR